MRVASSRAAVVIVSHLAVRFRVFDVAARDWGWSAPPDLLRHSTPIFCRSSDDGKVTEAWKETAAVAGRVSLGVAPEHLANRCNESIDRRRLRIPAIDELDVKLGVQSTERQQIYGRRARRPRAGRHECISHPRGD